MVFVIAVETPLPTVLPEITGTVILQSQNICLPSFNKEIMAAVVVYIVMTFIAYQSNLLCLHLVLKL